MFNKNDGSDETSDPFIIFLSESEKESESLFLLKIFKKKKIVNW